MDFRIILPAKDGILICIFTLLFYKGQGQTNTMPVNKNGKQEECRQTKKDVAKILDEFALSAEGNLSFQNGRMIQIDRPRNDKDALRKALKVVHRDKETYRDLEITGAKNLVIEDAMYRAVLYRHKKTGRCEIALYRKLQDDCYYLGFHPLRY